jgi:hypothetical protein
MPVISMFYGIIVMMYFFDADRHHLPHVHVKYGEFTAVIAIGSLDVLQGSLPNNKLRLILAWMEIHRDELLANWELAINGESLFRIDPLK